MNHSEEDILAALQLESSHTQNGVPPSVWIAVARSVGWRRQLSASYDPERTVSIRPTPRRKSFPTGVVCGLCDTGCRAPSTARR